VFQATAELEQAPAQTRAISTRDGRHPPAIRRDSTAPGTQAVFEHEPDRRGVHEVTREDAAGACGTSYTTTRLRKTGCRTQGDSSLGREGQRRVFPRPSEGPISAGGSRTPRSPRRSFRAITVSGPRVTARGRAISRPTTAAEPSPGRHQETRSCASPESVLRPSERDSSSISSLRHRLRRDHGAFDRIDIRRAWA